MLLVGECEVSSEYFYSVKMVRIWKVWAGKGLPMQSILFVLNNICVALFIYLSAAAETVNVGDDDDRNLNMSSEDNNDFENLTLRLFDSEGICSQTFVFLLLDMLFSFGQCFRNSTTIQVPSTDHLVLTLVRNISSCIVIFL